MQSEIVTYTADGLTMRSHLFYEAGAGPRPGVLIFPEAFGLGEHEKSRARRLAELGYVSLACDLHGELRSCQDLEEVRNMLGPLRADVSRIRSRAAGGFDALKARPEVDPFRIAAIGFCFGGSMALELARSGAHLAGAAGFHSNLSTTATGDAKNIKCRISIYTGADDPAVPLEQRTAFEKEMREAGVNWRMTIYGGVVHSFTNPDADRRGRPELARYDTAADTHSWRDMCQLFEEIFTVT